MQFRWLEDFLCCVYDGAKDVCGESAAQHELKFYQLLLGPTLEAAQCSISKLYEQR